LYGERKGKERETGRTSWLRQVKLREKKGKRKEKKNKKEERKGKGERK
jgi:hypothetical protein